MHCCTDPRHGEGLSLTSTRAVEYSPHIPRRTFFSLCTVFHVTPPSSCRPRDLMDAHKEGSPRETTASRPRILLLSFAKSVVGRRPVTSTWYAIETESCHSCHDTDGRIFGSEGRRKRKGMRRMCESGGGYEDPRFQTDVLTLSSSCGSVETRSEESDVALLATKGTTGQNKISENRETKRRTPSASPGTPRRLRRSAHPGFSGTPTAPRLQRRFRDNKSWAESPAKMGRLCGGEGLKQPG